MKAIVTGATGCVGRNLIDELLKDGWEIFVLHRKSSNLNRLKGLKINLLEVDLHDLDSVISVIPAGIDAMFHAAGNVSHWALEAEIQYKDNVLATKNLVKAAETKNVKRFIFTSTGATYIHENKTLSEIQKIRCNYIRTKLLAEKEVLAGKDRGLDVVIIRPCIIMGKYDFSNYSQIFQRIFLGRFLVVLPGTIWFNHAQDVARAHLAAFEKGKSGEAYFLDGNKTTWYDVYCRAAKIMNVKQPKLNTPLWLLYIFAHSMETFSYISQKKPLLTTQLIRLLIPTVHIKKSDTEKSRIDLNFNPKPLNEIIYDCCNWMLEEGIIKSKSPRNHLFN